MRTRIKPPPSSPPRPHPFVTRERMLRSAAAARGAPLRRRSEPDLIALAGTLPYAAIDGSLPPAAQQRPAAAGTPMLERLFFFTMILLLGGTNAYSLFDRHRFDQAQRIEVIAAPPSATPTARIDADPPDRAAIAAVPSACPPARDDAAPTDEPRVIDEPDPAILVAEQDLDPPIVIVDEPDPPKPRKKARKKTRRHR